MRVEDLRGKSVDELEQEVLDLRREQFNLRMQRATGQLSRPHEYGRVRKDIARVKTVISELKAKSENE